ncbi:hypothetical protein HPP92_026958 [Vanilla planifolia]|nr:hypothetical protein HPP92_026958 [Vanilla planifolia]
MEEREGKVLRVLCPKNALHTPREPGVRWLVGSSVFLPRFNVVSCFRCLHYLGGDPNSPDFSREADDVRTLLLRGFDIIGAISIGEGDAEFNARKVAEASRTMRKYLSANAGYHDMIGAHADVNGEEIKYFLSEKENPKEIVEIETVIYENDPAKFVWGKGCLIRCELFLKIPIYALGRRTSDVELIYSSLTDLTAAELKDPSVAFIIEGESVNSNDESTATILHGSDLDFDVSLSKNVLLSSNGKEPAAKAPTCLQFCSKNKSISATAVQENADVIRVTVMSNRSRNISTLGAPTAEYFPVTEPARCIVANFNLDVLCYSSKDFFVASAISELVVPGLIDQLEKIKNVISPNLLTQHPQLKPFHFLPPGILHPVTVLYELSYGENEVGQIEIRRSLHSRLGLPLDRPLLCIANAISLGSKTKHSKNNGYQYLKNVHTEIPASGVMGGSISMIDGSYEYFHYFLDGIDDNGWGCAYRSLQTIVSWFRLQHYTSVDVPSHRDIQQALVEIGDKEPSFVGSREWIGAIELSFVLDKLLGVSCKILNVRSGAELPEKCRELARHFELQGTPIMIGGGVLAYTLLGVDYNEENGDCAFLILDPHYTGNDDIEKIINGGWCGWKKAVDSKGRSFFLKDKFYNLLLPQRPNMV